MPGPSEPMQEASVPDVQIRVVGSGTCLGAEEDQRKSRRTTAPGWSFDEVDLRTHPMIESLLSLPNTLLPVMKHLQALHSTSRRNFLLSHVASFCGFLTLFRNAEISTSTLPYDFPSLLAMLGSNQAGPTFGILQRGGLDAIS